MSPISGPLRYAQPANGCSATSASSQKLTVCPMVLESFHAMSISSWSIVSPLEMLTKLARNRVPTRPDRRCWNFLNGWLRP